MKHNLWKVICAVVLLVVIAAAAMAIANRPYAYPVKRFSAEWSDRIMREENIAACQIPEKKLARMSDLALIRSAASHPFLQGTSAFDSMEMGFDVAKSKSNAVAELERRYLDAPWKFKWLMKIEIFRAELIEKLDFRDDMEVGKGMDNAMTHIYMKQFASVLEKKAANGG